MADDLFAQTQNVSDDMSLCQNDSYDSPSEDESVWGKLFPNAKAFELVLLNKDKVTFGRNPEVVDVQLKGTTKYVNVGSYSSVHFTITREKSSKNDFFVKIQDNSSNGTFVNGNRIGKGRFQILKSNDEISLAKPENKAYTFVDKSSNDDSKWPIVLREKYMICKELGKGAYGEVRLAFSNFNMKKVAIKIISKKKFTIRGKNEHNLTNSIMSEVNILKKLDHPCIIKIYEVIDTPDRVFIVLELVEGGELFDKVVSIGQYEEKTAKLLFYQMVLAIKYLHDQGISHRDLKPENILLCDRDNVQTLVKVTDFGLSKFFDSTTVLKTFCGTPNYLAPEVLTSKGEGMYTNKVDNWSLGVILYICLVGYPPFSEENTKLSLEQQIRKGAYDFPNEFWSNISKDAIDLVKHLLTVDADKRYSLEQVLDHKWLKDDNEVKEQARNLMYPSVDTTTTSSSNESNGTAIPQTNEDTNPTTNGCATLKRNNDEKTETSKKRLKQSKSNSTDKSSELA